MGFWSLEKRRQEGDGRERVNGAFVCKEQPSFSGYGTTVRSIFCHGLSLAKPPWKPEGKGAPNCDSLQYRAGQEKCGHGANQHLTSARTRPSTALLPWQNRVTETFSNVIKLRSAPVTGHRFLVFILDSTRTASSLLECWISISTLLLGIPGHLCHQSDCGCSPGHNVQWLH